MLYTQDNAGIANGIGATAYADVVGNPRAGVVQTPLDGFGPIYYNPAAFAAPRGLTFGDSGRNSLRNPHRINFDMALFKRFAFTERMGLEFRAEAFNVFNHTEWLPIAGDSGSAASAVGASTNHLNDSGIFRPNGVHNARVLQLALKFIF